MILIIFITPLTLKAKEAEYADQVIIYLKPKSSLRLRSKRFAATQTALKARYKAKSSRSYAVGKTHVGFSTQSNEMESKEEIVVLDFDENADIVALSNEISQDPEVLFAEPNYKVELFQDAKLHETPSDPYFTEQDYLTDTDLHYIWGIPAESDILVAVVDTGVDTTHEDLNHAIATNPADPINGIDDDNNGIIDDYYGANFYRSATDGITGDVADGHSHGTHISGIIAADANNNRGITGINPKAKILPVKFLNNRGMGTQLDGALAIRYAVDRGAKVINCSWGYFKKTKALEDAVTYAINRGVIVVAAVGNTSTSLSEYPAALPGVITVGSVDTFETRSRFSSYGNHLDFMTFGESIYSAYPHNRYGNKSGTSQSAGIISGIVSRVLAFDNTLSQHQIVDLLTQSSTLGDERDARIGHGVIAAPALLELMDLSSERVAIQPAATTDISVTQVLNFPNPFNAKAGTRFGFETDVAGAQATIQIFNLKGEKVNTLSHTTQAGYNTVLFNANESNGTQLKNGTYLYILTLESDGQTQIAKGKCTVLS